jgi:hypothetical protein
MGNKKGISREIPLNFTRLQAELMDACQLGRAKQQQDSTLLKQQLF